MPMPAKLETYPKEHFALIQWLDDNLTGELVIYEGADRVAIRTRSVLNKLRVSLNCYAPDHQFTEVMNRITFAGTEGVVIARLKNYGADFTELEGFEEVLNKVEVPNSAVQVNEKEIVKHNADYLDELLRSE